ncbi:M48 family metallopeptidase [Sphingomonas sp. CJ20]
MSAPSDAEAPRVWHFDGRSAVRRAPVLVPQGDGFLLVEEGVADGPFAFADLTAQPEVGAGYGLKGQPGWRIGFDTPPPPEIAARLPQGRRYGGVIDRIGLWPAAIGFALVSAVVVFVVSMTPALLVRLIPQSVEQRIGALMVGDFGGRTCSTEAGDAALMALSARLGISPLEADVRVVDVPIVNAVTLPGGHVLLFRGLIDQAESSDEVAGVLGHEIGHVEHRDVLQSLLRQFGLSVVLGGLDGNVGGYTNAVLSAGYSRAAESAADGYAIDTLNAARVSPAGAAGFFARLSKTEVTVRGAGTVLAYLSSHPMSSERKARFEAATKGAYTPALTAAQWQALRTICAGRPKQGWRDAMRF